MNVSIRPLHPLFVAEVAGIDLTRSITPDAVAAIDAGMAQFAVLVFRDHPLTDEQQRTFSLNFGPLSSPGSGGNSSIASSDQKRLHSGIGDLSNLDENNQPLARDDRRRLFNLSNRLWHSDSSLKAIPATYSMLSGRIVPQHGPNTEFADMRAAYDALDPTTRAEVQGLICEHSLIFSRGLIGFSEFTPQERTRFRPVRQLLVRTHPVSGRKSLYLSSHAGTIVGWPVPEARAFVRDLIEHATQPRFVYSHRWQPNDLVVWDNRTTMHRVRRYDDQTQRRDVRRTTVMGTQPTVAQACIE
jgi:alpha-ketoglutarate-dependent 2,4-dichlorophenoxyacetate dioxygenase